MTSPSTARILGMLTFFIGVALLVLVFVDARADLIRPLRGDATQMGMMLFRQIGFLFIMGYAASSIAGRGAQLYQAANVQALAAVKAVDTEEASLRPELPPSSTPDREGG